MSESPIKEEINKYEEIESITGNEGMIDYVGEVTEENFKKSMDGKDVMKEKQSVHPENLPYIQNEEGEQLLTLDGVSSSEEDETTSSEEIMDIGSDEQSYLETLPSQMAEDLEEFIPKCEDDVLRSIVTSFSGPSSGSITYRHFSRKSKDSTQETIFDRFDNMKNYEKEMNSITFLKINKEEDLEDESKKIDKLKVLQNIRERYSEFYNTFANKHLFTLKGVEFDLSLNKKIKKKFAKNVKKLRLATAKKNDTNLLNFFHNYEALSNNKIILLKNQKLDEIDSMFDRKEIKKRNMSPLQSEEFEKIEEIASKEMKGNLVSFSISKLTKQTIILGSDLGEVIEIDLRNDKVRNYTIPGKISACDITPQEKLFAAGSVKGDIVVKKTFGGWAKKTISSYPQKGQIVQIKFINDNDFLLCTNKDVVMMTALDMKLTFEIKQFRVFQSSPQVVQSIAMPYVAKRGCIIIVCEVEKVNFIALERGTKQIGEIKRPESVEKGLIPFVSWIRSPLVGEIYAVIFWGNKFILVKEENTKIKIVKQINLNHNVVWGGILDNSIICFLNENYKFYFQVFDSLFFNDKFNEGKKDLQELNSCLGAIQLEKTQFKDAKVICFREDGKLTRTYEDRIRAGNKEVWFLESKGISLLRLLSFKELAFKYIDNGKWLNSLLLCLDILSNEIKTSIQTKQEIGQVLEKIVNLYADSFLKNFSDEDINRKVLKTAVEALIKAKKEKLIFEQIKDKFGKGIFWEIIDEFISHGLIGEIPLNDIVEGAKYIKKDNLESLLLNLSGRQFLKDYESFNQLLMILKSKQLWSSFCKIALNTDFQSYKILLSSMLNEIVSSHNLENRIWLNFDPNNSDEFVLDPDFRIFWFLWKVFKWKNFQILVIDFSDIKKKEETWKYTMEWMFEDLNGNILSHKFIQLYLEIFYEIFLNKELMTNHHVFISLKKIFTGIMSKTSDSFFEDWKINVDFTKLTTEELILNLIFSTTSQELHSDVSFFVIKILNLDSFQNLFENKPFIVKIVESALNPKFKKSRFWMYYKDLSHEEVEDLILKVFMKISKAIPKDSLQRLQEKTKENGYLRINSFIVELLNGPLIALEYVIKNFKGGHVFTWINGQFSRFKYNSRTISSMCRIITKNLDKLMRESEEESKKIIQKFPNLGEDCFKVFGAFPHLQVDYVSKLLEEERKNPEEVDLRVPDKMKLKYLELICSESPELMTKILSLNEYPFDGTVDLLEKFKANEGLAFTYYQKKQYEKSSKVYLSVIKKSLSDYFEQSKQECLRHLGTAEFCVNIMVHICVELSKINSTKAKSLLVSLLDLLIESFAVLRIEKLHKEKQRDLAQRVCDLTDYIRSNFIELILMNYAQITNLRELRTLIQGSRNLHLLNISNYKGVLEKFSFDSRILKSVSKTSKLDSSYSKSKYISRRNKGHFKTVKCSITKEQINKKAILLPCPHPVDLQCAKSQCDYPKDFICSKCVKMDSLTRRALANLNCVHQENIKEKAIEAMREEALHLNEIKKMQVEKGFNNSELLDNQFNRNLNICFSDVVLDMGDFFEEVDEEEFTFQEKVIEFPAMEDADVLEIKEELNTGQ